MSKLSPQVLVKGTSDIDEGRLKAYFTSKSRGGGKNTVENQVDDSQTVITFQKFTGM